MNELPVVSIQNLRKSFTMNDGSGLLVLDDISLNVLQGEMVGFIGCSGCGKTTLLRIVGGFENPDSGYVLVDGKAHSQPEKSVLMLFQDLNQLLPWKTVLSNVTAPLLATGAAATKKEAESRALKRIAEVGLEKFAAAYPHQISGGMKQRAALARALALQPRVLLMDEPFASLDNITRKSLQILTRSVCEKYGVTVLFVTHSIDEAVIMADRIVVLNMNPGSIREVFDNSGRENLTSAQRGQRTGDVMASLGMGEM
ncbi:MAG: ATP-binding cassette domain-containing protein [Deltaproteobacteria bacterium]|jgi:NitT/TauT family transport system ATP-binding protein|nr:ATP-binding cassette domain-containing protein [Deltaproteobacteria bacterium]